ALDLEVGLRLNQLGQHLTQDDILSEIFRTNGDCTAPGGCLFCSPAAGQDEGQSQQNRQPSAHGSIPPLCNGSKLTTCILFAGLSVCQPKRGNFSGGRHWELAWPGGATAPWGGTGRQP